MIALGVEDARVLSAALGRVTRGHGYTRDELLGLRDKIDIGIGQAVQTRPVEAPQQAKDSEAVDHLKAFARTAGSPHILSKPHIVSEAVPGLATTDGEVRRLRSQVEHLETTAKRVAEGHQSYVDRTTNQIGRLNALVDEREGVIAKQAGQLVDRNEQIIRLQSELTAEHEQHQRFCRIAEGELDAVKARMADMEQRADRLQREKFAAIAERPIPHSHVLIGAATLEILVGLARPLTVFERDAMEAVMAAFLIVADWHKLQKGTRA